MMAPPVLLWFRNDLRLSDHAALHAALEAGPVLPVYALDEEAAGKWAPGGASRWWLHHSLAALAESLSARGSRLVLARGRAERELIRIADAVGASAVFAGSAIEPWARAQEGRVAEHLRGRGRPLRLFRTVPLFKPDAIRSASGGPFGAYSPFARACFARPIPEPLRAPARIAGPEGPGGDELWSWALVPTQPDWARGLRASWLPGERAARRRLGSFVRESLRGYGTSRDLVGAIGTSMLSPHLHLGEVSPAEVWQAAAANGPGAAPFLKELLWREFSIHLLWHHPELSEEPLRPAFASMPWRNDPAGLRAWQRGRTGIPIVDAAMRQLWQTGWMHNRARMITASFLVKHLLLKWQDGEAWFWDTLVDADLANNAASWQWVAGCGVDAAPYFRVFNPVLQGRKFDADGSYVRSYVPELALLPDAHLHAPWTAPETVLHDAGVRLGETYPRPIVDLASARTRAVAAFRGLSSGRKHRRRPSSMDRG